MSASPDLQGEEDEDIQASRAEQEEQDEGEGEMEMDQEEDRSVSAQPRKAVTEEEGTLIYARRWLDLKGEVIPSTWEKSVRCLLGWIMARPTSEVSFLSSFSSRLHLVLLLR